MNVFVGAVLWIPTLLLIQGAGLGPSMKLSEQIAIWAPVVFVAAPAAMRSSSSSSAWWIALTPLLMWGSFIATQVLRRVLFHGNYVRGGDLLCELIGALFWGVLGALIVLRHRRPNEQVNNDA